MTLREWSRYELDYGRKLVNSGIEGARSAGQEFLQGEPVGPILCDSARKAMGLAAAGACIGLLGARRKSAGRALAQGICGGVIGFGLGIAWGNRKLGTRAAAVAWKKMGRARDEHWLELHPIDYA